MKTYEKGDFNYPDIGLLCTSTGNTNSSSPVIPAKYQLKSRRITIGFGERVFDKATELLFRLKIADDIDWIDLIGPKDGSITTDTTIATLARFHKTFMWSLNPCRVVSAIRNGAFPSTTSVDVDNGIHEFTGTAAVTDADTDTDRYSEVVYSTLEGHLIAGEESFRILLLKPSASLSDVDAGGGAAPLRIGIHGSDSDSDSSTGRAVIFEVRSYSRGCGLLGSIAMPFVRPLQDKFLRDHCNAMYTLVNSS
mmetsp:Transcript_836/g.1277  ORF Transcript_836/g.1277 Transcript_836/m.1277 type:complete len:251 (-) Transcript_836:1070-1822(-)